VIIITPILDSMYKIYKSDFSDIISIATTFTTIFE